MTVSSYLPRSLSSLALCLFLIGCDSRTTPSSDSSENGWIGVYVQDLDNELRRYMDIKQRAGVLVNKVVRGGPADKAGLRKEDVIVRFDGKRIRNTDQLTRAVRRRSPGDEISARVVRNGNLKELAFTVGVTPEQLTGTRRDPWHAARAWRRAHNSEQVWLGVEMAEMNSDLAEYFKTAKRSGVLILQVFADSPADRAGLKAGDIISHLGNKKVPTPEDVRRVISTHKAGDRVRIQVLRHEHKKTLEVVLEERYSFHPDHDDMRAFHEGMADWQEKLQEWQGEADEWARDLERDGKIRIEIPLREMADELEAEMEGLGENLRREMKNLQKELRDSDIEIRMDRPGQTI